jgi:hypothetical protein
VATCSFVEINVDGAVLHAEVRTKLGSVKATLTGTLIVMNGPEEQTSLCELKLTRVDLNSVTPLCF